MAIWRMLFACWILKATNTHTVCVVLIASPLQHESTPMLHYMYIASLVKIGSD